MSDNGWGFYWFDATLTDVDVANMAMSEIGGAVITNLEDLENGTLVFNQTRDELLCRFPWTFGRGRRLIYPSLIELANSLKTLLNEHAADTAMHDNADTTNFPITTDDATTIDTMYELVGDMLAAYDAHDADAELGAGWAFHRAQESTDYSMSSLTPPTTQAEAVNLLNELRSRFNAHDADNVAHTAWEQHEETKEECGVPDFEFDYEYYLPSDYLGRAEFYDSSAYFIIEGNRILTDESSVMLKYQKRSPNGTIYSRLFSECFVLFLAAKLAMKIAQDKSLSEALYSKANIQYRNAAVLDAYEGNEETVVKESSWQTH